MRSSPGPKYWLPSATGYEGHDPTLSRAPALSIGTASRDTRKAHAPGPKYNCSGISRKGKFFSREAFLEGKPKFTYERTPGPLNYQAHLVPDLRHARPPAWVLGERQIHRQRVSSPAPKYLVPGSVGREVPHLPNAPAYSILGRDAIKLPKTCSPGPGKYPRLDNDVHLTRAITPLIVGKPRLSTRYSQTVPAPKYASSFNEKREPPSYSFGVKHSPYKTILYTPPDLQPFYGF